MSNFEVDVFPMRMMPPQPVCPPEGKHGGANIHAGQVSPYDTPLSRHLGVDHRWLAK
eukprot:gene24288-10333_t